MESDRSRKNAFDRIKTEVDIPLPDPPRPTYPPKPLAALPTLPPAIANKTFITPPVVEDTFQVKNQFLFQR